jgi:hypothetical protein
MLSIGVLTDNTEFPNKDFNTVRNHLVFDIRRSHFPRFRDRLSCQEEKFVLII